MKAPRLMVVALALCPALLVGQKREEIVAIQRDVANLEDKIKTLQKTLDENSKTMTALLQQVLDASNKNASNMTALQHNVEQRLNEQQTKLVAPVATLGTKVDQMSEDFRAVRENVADLVSRMRKMDAAVTDISNAVRTIGTTQTPPPTGVPGKEETGVPAGVSAESTYQNALRDLKTGKDQLAFDGFTKYLQYFKQTENAPLAQYYLGDIYMNAGQYEDAVKSFDAVLLNFPENPKNPDALYMKGVAYQKWGLHKNEAGKAYKELIKRYPDSSNVAKAHSHLRELGLEAGTSRKHN